MKMFKVILFAGFIAIAQTAMFNRACKPVEELGGIFSGFNAEKYLDKWYEIERYEQPFQRGLECVTAQYSHNDDGTIKVDNRGKNLASDSWRQDIGKAKLSYPNEQPLKAMLNVTFPPIDMNMSNYWVLSTDYVNYSIVYNCMNLPANNSYESYWLLSRKPKLSDDSRKSVDEIINKFVDRSKVRVTIQDSEKCV